MGPGPEGILAKVRAAPRKPLGEWMRRGPEPSMIAYEKRPGNTYGLRKGPGPERC
jgi:hypothetical protein